MILDLIVVMPVYNEQDCIVEVLQAWRARLLELGVTFKILVLNDGSRDGTKEALTVFAADSHIEVINKANSGHGPTILQGYREAAQQASWVFQCDSDDEMKPAQFPLLWDKRNQYDALFGMRQGRQQNIGRQLISACSRLTVKLLFGAGVMDVNVPYRLMRSTFLQPVIKQIPPNTFAPNVIISGAFSKAGLRLYNHPIPHESRATGVVSIMRWKLFKAVFKSFWQTVQCRPTIKKAQPPTDPSPADL